MNKILPLLLALASCGLVSGQHNPNFAAGRTSFVHLFEWRWSDIADECERYLGPNGFGGVQVSPVSENAKVNSPFRPWWERYQVVSYNNMQTRSGTEQEFASMVRRCNNVGVRIYVDAVINHMTGSGRSGTGTGGSSYNAPNRAFPEYSSPDFNSRSTCPSSSGGIEDWNNPTQIRNCELSGLVDLNQGKEYVKSHIAKFLNKLIGYGVAGFRIDAAKHMWPADLQNIFNRLDDLPTSHGFSAGSRPFIFQEVIHGDSDAVQGRDYFDTGRVTEFKYGRFLGQVFRGKNQLKWLVNWGTGWSMYPSGNALVFLSNHDNQRGHGTGGGDILTFRQSRMYKAATAFMLAHPYGVPRLMSSYYWEVNGNPDQNDWVGPPNNNGNILPVIINPDSTCGNGWICEHRWRSIKNMVKFRNVVAGTSVTNWWDNGNNQIAFCRGNKGFIAINYENVALNARLQTCLPPGRYCDVIAGSKQNGSCTGPIITVGSDGKADISLTNLTDDPVVAIHVDSKL